MLILVWVMLMSMVSPTLWGTQSGSPDQTKVVEEAWGILNREYLDPTFNHHDWDLVRREALTRKYVTRAETDAAIEAMLRPLDDPLTRLITAEELASTFDEITGKSGGIGVTDPWLIQDQNSGRFRILHLVAGSPACEGGVLPGDIIADINGKPAAGLRHDEFLMALRGQSQTSVSLRLLRDNKPVDLTLTRKPLSLDTARASLRTESGKRVGYIGLSQFAPGSPEEMRSVLNQLLEEKADGFVFDLRNNPGGFVPASREIAGLFLDREIVYFSVDRNGAAREWRAAGARITEKPVVVIANGATASAAEILTAALMDNHRAVVVGTRTFGQGLVHSVERLGDGSGLVFATAYFKTPSGLDVRQRGIQPNITVEAPEIGTMPQEWASRRDIQYERAAAVLLRNIRWAGDKGPRRWWP